MCKSHFKEHKRKTTPIPKVEANPTPPQPSGASVYDAILPLSVEYFPAHATVKGKMPLVAHLAEGFHGGKPPAWHRNEERRARGLLSVENPATQVSSDSVYHHSNSNDSFAAPCLTSKILLGRAAKLSWRVGKEN